MDVFLGVLTAAAVSGVLPLVNAELLILGAAAAVPMAGVPWVILACTVGQMSTKTALFGLARWAPAYLPEKARARLARASEAASQREGAVGSVIFTSALTGLPPFYGTSLACGALGTHPGGFVAAGLLGRGLRFAVLGWLGHTLGSRAITLFQDGGVLALLAGGG